MLRSLKLLDEACDFIASVQHVFIIAWPTVHVRSWFLSMPDMKSKRAIS